jgi:cell division protein FtsN
VSIKHDYKSDFTWKARRRVRLHGLLIIFLVVVGLFAALLAYIRHDSPQNSTPSQVVKKQDNEYLKENKPESFAVKPKYDFYKVLPERQVVIPKEEGNQGVPENVQRSEPKVKPVSKSTPSEPKPAQPTEASGGYIVQAGAFSNYADADQRKATIALLGIAAQIEKGVAGDGRVLHRVRIGPIKDINEVKRLRRQLKDNRIPSIAIKAR